MSTSPICADRAIDSLRRGEAGTIVTYGNALRPRILSGATVTLMPVSAPLSARDVVLVDLPGQDGDEATLSIVLGICDDAQDGIESVLVGDARGNVNGWIDIAKVHGRAVAIANPEPRANLRDPAGGPGTSPRGYTP